MNYLWLSIQKKAKDRLLMKCYKNKIAILSSKEDDKNFFILIKKEDLKKLQKVYYGKIKIQSQKGLLNCQNFCKRYSIFIIALIFAILTFFILNHIMVDVQIIHSNKEIRTILESELEKYGIKKNSFKKSYQELQAIKEKILQANQEKLEWLEIEAKGMKYIVKAEERIITTQDKEKTKCNIIAKKEGIIKKLIYSKGEAKVQTNDTVKKGDILISGKVMKDEELKKEICATGKVYAEVWYKAAIKVPLSKEENILTGKVRYNLKYDQNLIFKSRVLDYQEEIYPLFKLFDKQISFVKQKEVIKQTKKYNEEELSSLASNILKEKMKLFLEADEQIISQKIISQEKDGDALNISYFLIVLEQIGEEQLF